MSRAEFANSYEVSPIILMGGSAANAPGGGIPIVSILQAQAFSQGLTSTATPGGAPFATFTVPAGDMLIDNDVAHWPLANQATAANAVISKPLHVSLRMICPAGEAVSYTEKQAVMTALKSTLDQHIAAGGWFSVATPSFIWQTALLLSLTDVSEVTEGGQVQLAWEWLFEQPIITDQQAQVVMNQAMAKISSGTQVSGDPPAADAASNTVGTPYPPVGTSVVPSNRPLAGAGVAPAPATPPSPFPGG